MLPKELMTDTKRRREKSTSIIPDPRSENRQNFLNIPLTDPRQKLAEQNIIAAKERRQKNFKESRENRTIEEEKETKMPENPNNKQLAQLVKQLAETLKQFELTTRKELENIRKQIDLKSKIQEQEKEKWSHITQSFENKLIEFENLIPKQNQQKEIKNHIHIKEFYIHNHYKYKNGLAMLKIEENKYIRVPLIPRYRYNKYSRKWTTKYFVQSMKEWISFEQFLKNNKDTIVVGRADIVKSKIKHDQIKKENMKAYGESFRTHENDEKEIQEL